MKKDHKCKICNTIFRANKNTSYKTCLKHRNMLNSRSYWVKQIHQLKDNINKKLKVSRYSHTNGGINININTRVLRLKNSQKEINNDNMLKYLELLKKDIEEDIKVLS